MYYHPAEKIDQLIISAGFCPIAENIQGEWRVVLFEKTVQ
jgi:hypothetical protein